MKKHIAKPATTQEVLDALGLTKADIATVKALMNRSPSIKSQPKPKLTKKQREERIRDAAKKVLSERAGLLRRLAE